LIDSQGHLHCDKCNKEHLLKLDGLVEWYCPRCHHFNRVDTRIVLPVLTNVHNSAKVSHKDN
jgi:phage FluMu protein Com